MYKLEFIKHQEASVDDLKRAIIIKQTAWPYPYESQKKWIQDNLKEDDVHVFLKKKDEYVAYLNLVQVNVVINTKNKPFLGIGNVCAIKQHSGFGGLLMGKIYLYLVENKYRGILFCKDELVRFYQKYHWSLVPSEKLSLVNYEPNVNTMICNVGDVDTLQYSDRNF